MNFNLSFYPNVRAPKPSHNMTFEDFIDNVQTNPEWQEAALQIQAINDKAERREAKTKLPGVRLSGTFSGQSDDSIITKSGLIGMDIDDFAGDLQLLKEQLCHDQFVAGAFFSVSGNGLCAVFRITTDDYAEAYIQISAYLRKEYNITCDPACKNISRFRFITHDGLPYINLNAVVFDIKPPKTQKKADFVPYSKDSDVEYIIGQIQNLGIDITTSYEDWLKVGFAIADEYGENGRNFYHILSQNHPEYNTATTDKKYDSLLRGRNSSKRVSIRSLFYIAAQHGIRTVSPERAMIDAQAQRVSKTTNTTQDLVGSLAAVGVNISEDNAKIALEAAKTSKVSGNAMDLIGQFIISNFDLYRNGVTQRIYCKADPMHHKFIGEQEINSMFVRLKQIEPKVKIQDIKAYINSENTPTFHPFADFIAEKQGYEGPDVVAQLIDCIKVEEDKAYGPTCQHGVYKQVFMRKWLLGVVGSMQGHHNELMPILCGAGGIGKTVFVRELLPKSMRYLFGSGIIGMGKDDQMKMNEFLILLDDEFSGKTTRDFKTLKQVLSLDYVTIRLPYAATTEKLQRIASWIGTSNETQIIDDPTGNRRFVPMTITEIDQKGMEKIDREALWSQLVTEYTKADTEELRKPHHLTREEMKFLNMVSAAYAVTSAAQDLVSLIVDLPQIGQKVEYLSSSEILALMKMKYRVDQVNPQQIGRVLTSLGFEQSLKRTGTMVKRMWKVSLVNSADLGLIGREVTLPGLTPYNTLTNEDFLTLPN
jgi:hypothetical protein